VHKKIVFSQTDRPPGKSHRRAYDLFIILINGSRSLHPFIYRMSTVAADKLNKLHHATERLGGKGTPRRKVKKSNKSSATSSAAFIENDKKIANALKKVNAQFIPGLEEVNLFKEDGNIIHIPKPTGTQPPCLSSFYLSCPILS